MLKYGNMPALTEYIFYDVPLDLYVVFYMGIFVLLYKIPLFETFETKEFILSHFNDIA